MPDTTPNPLPECPREDCPATIDHVHNTENSDAYECPRQLGLPCPTHDHGGWRRSRCYAPRTQPAPQPPAVVLPTVNEAVAAIVQSMHDGGWTYGTAAQAVLDLIAARLPVWQPVELGTVIKAGTRWRCESGEGATLRVEEETAATPYTCRQSACRYYIDPRTSPAEPSGVERACRLLSFAHGVTVTPEQIRATLDELGLELTDSARADQ